MGAHVNILPLVSQDIMHNKVVLPAKLYCTDGYKFLAGGKVSAKYVYVGRVTRAFMI